MLKSTFYDCACCFGHFYWQSCHYLWVANCENALLCGHLSLVLVCIPQKTQTTVRQQHETSKQPKSVFESITAVMTACSHLVAADRPGGRDAGRRHERRGHADRVRLLSRTKAPPRLQHPVPLQGGRPQKPARGEYLTDKLFARDQKKNKITQTSRELWFLG